MKKKKRKSSRRKISYCCEAVEFLREKAKLDRSLREEELQLRKDQQSQTLVLLQQQQQMNQVLLSLMEKMVEKQKKIEQFIYQFTSVRCFLISILITAIRHSVSSLMNILIIFFHIHSGSVRSRVQQQRDKYRANSERTKCRFCQVP